MMTLHEIMDEQVDVYKENERFLALLAHYYLLPDKKDRDEMFFIMFRCAGNILKKKYGFFKDYEWIEEKSLDICNILFNRIDNRTKWPNGYVIKNLPAAVRYAVMNVVYDKNEKLTNIEWTDQIDLYLEYRSLDDYNNNSWEDQILERIDLCRK